jgi:hypothetical protein
MFDAHVANLQNEKIDNFPRVFLYQRETLYVYTIFSAIFCLGKIGWVGRTFE